MVTGIMLLHFRHVLEKELQGPDFEWGLGKGVRFARQSETAGTCEDAAAQPAQ